MEIYKVYKDEGFTGANTDRPALQEMMTDIQQGKVNVVLSYKIDRLTRSPKDFYQLIELFEKDISNLDDTLPAKLLEFHIPVE